MLTGFFLLNFDDQFYFLINSGGAILTYLAAKYHLTKEETSRIDVVTLGGGKSITRKYFSGRTVNYYSRNDPLTLIDQRAKRMLKQAVNEWNETSGCETRDPKHNTSFVFLPAKANNAVIDHSAEGEI